MTSQDLSQDPPQDSFKEAWLLLRSFVVAELFKLQRSRVAKAMAIATAIVSPLIIGVIWLLLGDEGTSTFPRVLELIYLPLWLLPGLIGLMLTVEVLGNEFEQDTVRTVVGRGTPRGLFVGGKVAALLIAMTVNCILCTLPGSVLATISHLSQLGTNGLGEGLGELFISWLPAAGIAILVGSVYVGILSSLIVLTRSSALAMLGGLFIFGSDFIITNLGTEGFDPGAYSILRNTFVLFSKAIQDIEAWVITLKGFDDFGPWRAFFTLALYAVAGVALAYCVFRQQDLTGKK